MTDMEELRTNFDEGVDDDDDDDEPKKPVKKKCTRANYPRELRRMALDEILVADGLGYRHNGTFKPSVYIRAADKVSEKFPNFEITTKNVKSIVEAYKKKYRVYQRLGRLSGIGIRIDATGQQYILDNDVWDKLIKVSIYLCNDIGLD